MSQQSKCQNGRVLLTPDEEAFLIENGPHMTVREVRDAMATISPCPRVLGSIRSSLQCRGITPKKAIRRWSDDDRAYLEKYYRDKPAQEIADHLGVSKGSVYAHAFTYGISKSHSGSRNYERFKRMTKWRLSLMDILDKAAELDSDPYTEVDIKTNRKGKMAVYARKEKKRAFLLAAGLGTRLRPLTDTTPKCLLPINGHPLMYYWFQLLMKHNIDHVLVNTHHLAPTVKEYVRDFLSASPDLSVTVSFEKELLGGAGTVKANSRYIENEREFLICYADNLTNVNLGELLRFHRSKDAILTMGLFHTPCPTMCGIIAEMTHDNLIVDYTEKPENPSSNLANTGIYVASPAILDYIPDGFADFGHDVLPKLVGKMYGYKLSGYLRDIGTYGRYAMAMNEWRSL